VGSSGGSSGRAATSSACTSTPEARLALLYGAEARRASSETWPADGELGSRWRSCWVTGTFDPELNLLYWGTGNPAPTTSTEKVARATTSTPTSWPEPDDPARYGGTTGSPRPLWDYDSNMESSSSSRTGGSFWRTSTRAILLLRSHVQTLSWSSNALRRPHLGRDRRPERNAESTPKWSAPGPARARNGACDAHSPRRISSTSRYRMIPVRRSRGSWGIQEGILQGQPSS